MKTIQVETTIAAPKDRVFAAATDFENAPKRISSIKKVELLTPGPVRVGTKWRETRAFGKREGTEVFEVMMRGVMTKCVQQDLADLKKYLEGGA